MADADGFDEHDLPETLMSNFSLLSAEQQSIAKHLVELGQSHLFDAWPPVGERDDDKCRLLNQVIQLNHQYAGGLTSYVANACRLLHESKLGINPFEGFVPEIPDGKYLPTGSDEFLHMERVGMANIADLCFVLVAGGLGERLGYHGIKVELPTNLCTETCFLELYIQHILALQTRARQVRMDDSLELPFAIMTSDDTHAKTTQLLQSRNYFGALPSQITLMKQELVPAIQDIDGRFALSVSDPFAIQVKPHGHGDVHTLLFQTGLAEKWLIEQGCKWVLFFQDTNALVFHAVPALLGASVCDQLAVNSMSVARKPGEANGSICKLTRSYSPSDSTTSISIKESLTINVEYNQLEPLLKATISPDGDVADPSTGNSKFPGNTNVLLFALEPYYQALKVTGGAVPEFVNPKYQNLDKTKFTPTRLECMMQDFPKLLGLSAKVGFTQFDRWLCYSSVKNSLHEASTKALKTGFPMCASSSEFDQYFMFARKLQLCGAHVEFGPENLVFSGIPVPSVPQIIIHPSFSCSLFEMKEKLARASGQVRISNRSSLLIQSGNVDFHHLSLDGALVISPPTNESIGLIDANVQNAGWMFQEIDQNENDLPETLRIRGYKLIKSETQTLP